MNGSKVNTQINTESPSVVITYNAQARICENFKPVKQKSTFPLKRVC